MCQVPVYNKKSCSSLLISSRAVIFSKQYNSTDTKYLQPITVPTVADLCKPYVFCPKLFPRRNLRYKWTDAKYEYTSDSGRKPEIGCDRVKRRFSVGSIRRVQVNLWTFHVVIRRLCQERGQGQPQQQIGVKLSPHHSQEDTPPQDQTPAQAFRTPQGMNRLNTYTTLA